jgi:uncharacterized membrane protein
MNFLGLPLHPLVVHGAVVFGVLAPLAGVLYAVVPAWRDWLRWPYAGLALAGGGAVLAAYLTGTRLLESRPELKALPAVQLHRERAGVLLWVAIGFLVVSAWAVARHRAGGVEALVTRLLLAAVSVAMLAYVTLVGDAGSRAVWGA